MYYTAEELKNLPAILHKPGGKMAEKLARTLLISEMHYQEELTQIAFGPITPDNWRACWVLDCIARLEPQRMVPWIMQHQPEIIRVSETKQAASFLNMLSRMKTDEEHLIPFFDFACKWAQSAASDNVNYFALKLMMRVTQRIPELTGEVKLYAEEIRKRTEKPYLKRYTREILIN